MIFWLALRVSIAYLIVYLIGLLDCALGRVAATAFSRGRLPPTVNAKKGIRRVSGG